MTTSSWRPDRTLSFRPIDGIQQTGVFVYRTIEDLENESLSTRKQQNAVP